MQQPWPIHASEWRGCHATPWRSARVSAGYAKRIRKCQHQGFWEHNTRTLQRSISASSFAWQSTSVSACFAAAVAAAAFSCWACSASPSALACKPDQQRWWHRKLSILINMCPAVQAGRLTCCLSRLQLPQML